jgi:high-affinity iron transporter
MLPSFLITFREVIEASLIVATILGILTKLGHEKSIKTVWMGTVSALLVSILILIAGSILGLKIQELYSGKIEAAVEGVFMILSASFITWAVFFLHTYFAHKKMVLIQKVKQTLDAQEQSGIFMLVFTAVFREGLEIVLFLSTIYLSSNPTQILEGFTLGLGFGLLVSFSIFSATIKLPVYRTFRITSGLLILFAAGLIARGVGEFIELGTFSVFNMLPQVNFVFIPRSETFFGHIIQTIFGVSRSMNTVSLMTYLLYVALMGWWVFIKHSHSNTSGNTEQH